MQTSRARASRALLLLLLLVAPPVRAQDVVGSPREQYALGAVGFESTVVVGPWAGRDWAPYVGKYHRPLEGIAFYEALGRPDLVSRYRSRQAVRYTLMLGGVAASIVGLVMFRDTPGGGGWMPITVFLGGGVVTSVGWYMSPDPLDGSEARQAADLYNKALKHRLGLDEPVPPAVPGQLTLGAFPAPGGAAFSLAGRF